jgi:ATP-dependent helicase/nuclease subunit A
VFVAANAGSGKTSTLVRRVARLLLRGARPEAILCVTYTKAAAAEMQRRLFQELGDWAVTEDAALADKLAEFGEPARNLGLARALFARALETPGGIKITTIHAFCEKLLKRFPLEAGVAPGFTVLDDAAAREVSARAREDVAMAAMADADSAIGRAYAYFSVELDHRRFQDMFAAFEAERRAIRAYAEACAPGGGYGTDIWKRCGFAAMTPAAEIEAEAVARIRWGQWRRAAEALMAGRKSDQETGAAMLRLTDESPFTEVWALFANADGEPTARLATKSAEPFARDWLAREQARLGEARERAKAARIAEASVHAVSLALAYIEFYDGAKAILRALDFGDLIQRTHELLTVRADAAWVLFKLDGGVDHVLLDEAQDTAPDQWDIIRALTAEFFVDQGAGERRRTVFAVGDEKQSIFSFQGAAPERLAAETEGFAALVFGAEREFRRVQLAESWRSAPEILRFVDQVFEPPGAAAGLKPAGSAAFPIRHLATRPAGGTVDLWPLEETEQTDEPDPWLAPVDAPPKESANKKLAQRIARSVRSMVTRGETVADRRGGAPRPMGYGDVLILVRRRGALFHEIIRALKRADVPVGGADRLLLSEHVAFQDLLALGRFARFPLDDLTLAALLRSPFCAVDEAGLFELAHGRRQPLWTVLQARAPERPAWGEAVRFLAWAKAAAEARAPFDFYGRVLARLDERSVSMKRRFLVRLGREAEDALDAFLAEALAAERRGVIELERFIAEMAASEIEVKREQEDTEGRGAGEVRVMTAHGAKGLEAPVVVLPDTTTRATALGGPLLAAEDGGFLWAPRKAEDCPASAAARAERERAAEHESLRLLYVALTRARDRLIVCGVRTQNQFFRGSWREHVETAFAALGEEVREAPLDGGGVCRRFGADPGTAAGGPAKAAAPLAQPAWAGRLAPAEPAAARFTAPSRLAEAAETPSSSPLARTLGLGRYRRGEIIHRLLQQLPDLEPAGRAVAAARLLARERDLTEAQRAEMSAAAFGVLEDPRFAAVFGPGSRAEIALAGTSPRLPPGLSVSGRVDRLLVEDHRVLVADFKSNRPAPAAIEAADPAYVRQMAAYWAVLQEIFPGRAVEAALIWTDGPRLMPIPENLLVRALAEMRSPA